MHQFDPSIPNYLEGDITSVALTAPAGFPPPAMPNNVVDPNQPFTITIEWEVYGVLTPLWLAALSNNWRIEVFAESLGGGQELRIGSAQLPKTASVACTANPAAVNCQKWTVDVTVPAGTLQEGNPGGPATSPSGIYKLAMSVFLNSTLGTPGFDLVGYYEGPVIQVESPV